jgi:hypothetical protein
MELQQGSQKSNERAGLTARDVFLGEARRKARGAALNLVSTE